MAGWRIYKIEEVVAEHSAQTFVLPIMNSPGGIQTSAALAILQWTQWFAAATMN